MKVNQIDISKDMKVSDLVAQFEASDVLGAGRVARATNILANMIKDEDTNVFMSLGGPLIPGGMRNIVSQMIREGHVDLIVSAELILLMIYLKHLVELITGMKEKMMRNLMLKELAE